MVLFESDLQSEIKNQNEDHELCKYLEFIDEYKPTSLYQEGMKILAKIEGQEPKRVGTAIKYAKNSIEGNKDSYFLEFLYEFESITKPVHFSYFYAYDYSNDLVPHIENLENKHYKKKIIKKQVLCKTCMGNDLFMLTISNNIFGPIKNIIKPIIYIIGRQHSGESPGSFVVEGILNFLLSSRFEANELREQFEFRIIPMVNIDGVISGNYRTNISGNDVNRQWLFPSKLLNPEIYHLKQELLTSKKNVLFFLDIHAHSRKMNSFFYGSSDITKSNKLYPFVCSKLNKFISYKDSSFSDDPTKISTARVSVQKELNIVNSLTFEISFYGWIDQIKKTKHHFKPADLEDIGISLALGLYYSQISLKNIEKEKSQIELLLKSNKTTEKEKVILKNTLKISEKWKVQLEKELKLERDDAISEGSSIDPEHFTLEKEEILKIEEQYEKLNGDSDKKKLAKNKETIFLETSYNKTNLKNQDIKISSRYKKLMSSKLRQNKSKLSDYSIDIDDEEKNEKNFKSNLFTNSINEFFTNSSKNLTVKQLEEELQGKVKYMSLSEPENSLKSPRRTMDFKSSLRYHDKIREIKNNFTYCLKQSENEDFLDLSFENKSTYKKFVPSLKEDDEIERNSSLKSRSRKTLYLSLKTKRGTSFNENRGNSFVRYKNESNFKLEKV